MAALVSPNPKRTMIRTFLERRRVRREFGKLIDPETAKTLLRDGDERQPVKQGRIEFVLAFVRGKNPSQISERMARVADLAVGHGALVHDLVGGLVIVAFGTHPHPAPQTGGRALLVQALRDGLEGDVKVVHGAAEGQYGLFGSQARMSYTFLVPQFDSILAALGRLQFGETEEFRP